ncbi:hypothetical protein HPDP_00057 [Candidatus Hepatincola sp. Pdp]
MRLKIKYLLLFATICMFTYPTNNMVVDNVLWAAEVSTQDMEKIEDNRIKQNDVSETKVSNSNDSKPKANTNKTQKSKTVAEYLEDILFTNKIQGATKVKNQGTNIKKNVSSNKHPSVFESDFGYTTSNQEEQGKTKVKEPLFFISQGKDSLPTEYSYKVCSLINNQNFNYNCLVYPLKNGENFAPYMKKGLHSEKFATTGVNGDFILLREDEYLQYEERSKKDNTLPKLDVLMFLNGEYIFMFANKMNNTFSLEQIIANKILDSNGEVKVGVINSRASNTFSKVVAPLFSSAKFIYQPINAEDYNASFCQPNDLDLYIYIGEDLPKNVKKALEPCIAQLNPLAFSNKTLAKITKKYPFFSVANIVDYYPASAVLNYVEIYVALESAYQAKIKAEKERKQKEKLKTKNLDFALNGEDNKIVPVANSKQEVAKEIDSDPNSGNTINSKLANQNMKNNSRVVTGLPPAPTQEQLLAEEKAEQSSKEKADKIKKEQQAKKEQEKIAKEKKAKEQANKDAAAKTKATKKEASKKSSSRTDTSSTTANKKNQNYYVNNTLVVRETALPFIVGKKNDNTIGGKIKDFTQITKTEPANKMYNITNVAIKTFGVRYVLLASRYTKKDSVLITFDSIIKNYFLVKADILTPDMNKFSISDLILGTSSATNLRYHPFLLGYPVYLLESSMQKSPEQVIALKLLNNESVSSNVPPFYGPQFPSKKQLDTIFLKMRYLNKQRNDLITLRVFQRDMQNIQSALLSIRTGKAIDSSVLKSTGLDHVSVIYDDKSVIYQNTEESFNAQVGNVSGKPKASEKSTLDVISETLGLKEKTKPTTNRASATTTAESNNTPKPSNSATNQNSKVSNASTEQNNSTNQNTNSNNTIPSQNNTSPNQSNTTNNSGVTNKTVNSQQTTASTSTTTASSNNSNTSTNSSSTGTAINSTNQVSPSNSQQATSSTIQNTK